MCDFLIDFWMHVYACEFFVMYYHWNGDFARLTVVLPFPYHFLGIHGVVVFFPHDCFMIGAHNYLWLWVGTNAFEVLEQLGLSY